MSKIIKSVVLRDKNDDDVLYVGKDEIINNTKYSVHINFEESIKEPQECNSDLISRKKLIEALNHEDLEFMQQTDLQKCLRSVINNQPQVQPIVRTQADRIRNMSDEELAEFLEKIASGNRSVIGTDCGNNKCESWKCTECILTYLQSEVKEV